MQVHQQILDLLLIEGLVEPRHLAASDSDDFANAFVVGRQAALCKKRLFENPFQSGALFSAGRIRLVALIAVAIVDTSSRALLLVQSQLGVGLSKLRVAALQQQNSRQGTARPARSPLPVFRCS